MNRRLHALGAVAVIAIVLVAFSGVAMAAKGGAGKPTGGSGGSTSSVSLVPLGSSDGRAHWGQQITFNVSTAATDRPYVNVDCKQGGALVYSNQVGYYPSYPWVQYFTLSSDYWTAGDADCSAALTFWNGRRWSTITSISFHVYA